MRRLGKVARLGLAGLMVLPFSLGSGCMSMQPVRDQQGNVIVDQYGNPMYRPQFDAGKTARVIGGGILETVAGAHHAGKIVDYDAANKAALMGRGMQMIGNSDRGHYVHQGGGWPASQPVQQYQQGAWVTDLHIDFYSFLWTDHNNNGRIDWILMEEVGERKNNFSASRERTGLCLDIKCAKPRQSFLVKLYEGDRFIDESNLQVNDFGGFLSMFPVSFNKPGYYTVNVTTGGKKVKEVGINVVP